MRLSFVLLASSLAIAATGALAQGNADACHNHYGACVERCGTRPQSMQQACSSSCEATTNQCYGEMYKNAAAPAEQPGSEQAATQEPEARAAHDEGADAKPKKKKSRAKKKY